MSGDRTSEIWATRLQKELLSLTTADPEKDPAAVLPPFVKIDGHSLDIDEGLCKVNFRIEIPAVEGDDERKGGTIKVVLDTSLPPQVDGEDRGSEAYPFQKPKAIVASGIELLPPGSTVKAGDSIDIECDWTPSLHLNDAVQNVALQIRECVKQKEPIAPSKDSASKDSSEDISKKINSFLSSISKGGKSMMDSMSVPTMSVPTMSVPSMSVPSPSFSLSTSTSSKSAAVEGESPRQRQAGEGGTLEIGDYLDLTAEPWKDHSGLYACRAIRRPEFIEAEIARAEEQMSQVSSAGFAGAASMFRSVTQSAKSVLEESYLLINEEYIIELRANKFSPTSGTVSFAIPVSYLAKLKFRRQESISLFFKQAPEDPLIFMCPESAKAVQQIQHVLKRHGVRGKHTNAQMQKSVALALQIVKVIQVKEKELEDSPSVKKVDEIMDLYRQAAEKFETAGDARHLEVMSHMHKFLAKPLVAGVLDESRKSLGIPQGEVIESTTGQLEEEETDDEGGDMEFRKAMKQADEILKEATRDMANFGVEDLHQILDSPDAKSKPTVKKQGTPGTGDSVAELDAMLNASVAELESIMTSS